MVARTVVRRPWMALALAAAAAGNPAAKFLGQKAEVVEEPNVSMAFEGPNASLTRTMIEQQTGFCRNHCWRDFGFVGGDCRCHVQGSWYMWVCSKWHGQRIKTQFCAQHSCRGCQNLHHHAPPHHRPQPSPHKDPHPSCASYGCVGYKQEHTCQCNAQCERYGNCCEDFWGRCRAPPPAPSPTYAPAPQPRWTPRPTRSPTLAPSPSPTLPPFPIILPVPAPTPSPSHSQPSGQPTVTPFPGHTSLGPAPAPPASDYHPKVPALTKPSNAKLHTFYMYKAQNDEDYPLANQNAGNIAGILWYLHNEIVWQVPRRFSKTRIQRFKVSTRTPQPLVDQGMNFGVRLAFDFGQCTGPGSCEDLWDKWGFFVGCNRVGEYPTAQWSSQVHYPRAVWYSLPGACSSQRFDNHSHTCELQQPGGLCSGTPTGQGNCTYSYEPAGFISLNELDGIKDYWSFVKAGGREYVRESDRGIHTSFWDWKWDDAACANRVKLVQQHFEKKYPDSPKEADMQGPMCDFDMDSFYG